MRLSAKHLAGAAFLLTGAALFAQNDAVPTTQPFADQVSGKLGKTIQLFNGKDIDGWTWITNAPKGGGEKLSKDAIWSVKDGILHCNGKEVSGFTPGYLREGVPFTNYILTVEQRHVTKGGGGILIGLTGEDKVWPKNLQIQGTFGDVGDYIDQYGVKLTPVSIKDGAVTEDPARGKPRKDDLVIKKFAPTSEKNLGEFYTVQTYVDHGKVWTLVNGVLQNAAIKTEPLTGTIGLQAEGAVMEFRKIELTPIEDGK